ncbi:MAG: FAD-dependent oxidoreductase [Rhodobiaceae bacterium]|nr:FAD-dependent oxidoreductase [Rhodobiaceae bacterium]MCC0052975.1 FAD-dependent oxidoreductase [Rhodobiaceae bacterium]
MAANPQKRTCIVGAGFLGLTLALRLSAAGNAVTILEASDRPGGLADAWRLDDVVWDRHYHVILPVDRALIALLEELDLSGNVTWTKTGTDLFDGTRFHPLNGGIDFLRLPMLSFIDKARLAATILYASRISDGDTLSDIGVEDWLTRLSGARVFDTIWRPLLRAKLGDTYENASAQFIQAIARRLYAARASGVARDRFGVVQGGYATILERLVSRLEAHGVDLRLGTGVERIRRGPDGLRVVSDAGLQTFDRVIVTTPPALASRMCGELGGDEHARLEGVPYQGVICASALMDARLRGSYMTYITDADCPLTTIIDMSAVAGRAVFGGRTLAYLPMYLASDDALFNASDDAIETIVMDGLNRLYPDIRREDIAAMRISRARHVLPVPVRGYAKRVPAIVTSVPGLYTASSANIVNGTLNINETIELAERTLAGIAADPRCDAPRPLATEAA